VLGDDRYGGRRVQVAMARPFLHAAQLGFLHPATHALLEFTSPLPPDLVAVLARFS
jgi:23S rRNA pseudouridine1911/1915/1917 synthase